MYYYYIFIFLLLSIVSPIQVNLMIDEVINRINKFISSNRFKIKAKQKETKVILITTFKNSLDKYLFIIKDLIMSVSSNFLIYIFLLDKDKRSEIIQLALGSRQGND